MKKTADWQLLVKCDESKPGCARCEKSGWPCGGYETLPKIVKPKERALPKRLAPLSRSSTPPTVMGPVFSLPHRTRSFQSLEEHQYFRCFQDTTVVQLSGFLDAHFWGGLVLQACETESPVRRVAVAIGALNFQSNERHTSENQLLRQEFAYREYSRAIKEIYEATHNGTHSLRTNLIACLLFTCFELINHNDEAAHGQINAGLKLIDDWFACHTLTLEEWRPREHPLRSPNRWVLEDEVLHMFGRVESEFTKFCDIAAATEFFNQQCEKSTIRDIPAYFDSITEARLYLDVIRRIAMSWRKIYWSAENRMEGFSILTDFSKPEGGVYEDDFVGTYMDVYHKHFEIMALFEQWEAAFAPLWEEAQRSRSGTQYMGAASLRLQWLNGYLRQCACSGDESIYYGRFTAELNEIIDLSRILLAHSPTYPNHLSISLDENIVAPLDTVGCRFRNRRLRRDAIQLLRDKPRKEGAWNGVVCAKAIEWFADLEEVGLDEDVEFVPPERVLKGIEWHVVTGTRTTRVRCLQPSAFAPGEWIRRELMVPSD